MTGDASALIAKLYDEYGVWFRKRLVRRYGVHEVDDLAQETWLRLVPYQGANDVRHPKALLLRIAANLAADRFGRRAKRGRLAEEVGKLDGWGMELPAQTDAVLARQLVLGLPQPLRDRIVIGEMRDGAAALEALKSWNTGHPGGLSTLHANSAEDVLRRVEDLIAEVSARTPQVMIGQAVDLIVQIDRTPFGRRVETILAVEGHDGDRYRMRRLDAPGGAA